MYQVIEYASTEEVEVLFVQSFNLYFPSYSLVDRMEVFIDEVSPLLNDLEAYEAADITYRKGYIFITLLLRMVTLI